MVRHFNTSIAQDIRRIFGIKENLNSEIGDSVIPVVQITRIPSIFRNATPTTSGTATIFTTPPDKDFYLSYAMFQMMKNAAADNTNVSFNVVIDGAARTLIQFETLSLTAFTDSKAIVLNPPVLLDRNSGITMTGAFTVGAMSRSGVIAGYTVELTNNIPF